ncbi:MAG: bifunctional 5,10-methylenetetrahydrofolate dehydrogenase/5,10-methenyltetrahydrofolate cyclohydrolase [Candidatus Altiarchaeota archaeon]|nr:bifunctional 5,10-methylenetetrahydrofolate dehydrogenase/5,10-methenyltetrahydrofolate cyclohydrolase [Candidatus Altiarchaeota archaeon]
MKLIDGTGISREIREDVKADVKKLNTQGISPSLATVLVGENPASALYVKMKSRACDAAGINSKNYNLPSGVSEEELLDLINSLNNDSSVHGILVQLPLPVGMDVNRVFKAIDPKKDVDGITPVNMGNLMLGDESMVSCTPKGIVRLLEHEGVRLEGSDVVVVSHSVLVGKPITLLLLNRNSTVTVCHVHTRDLAEHTLRAKVLIAAAGVPHLIKKDMVGQDAVVVDVGTNRVGGKLVGDVDFEEVKKRASLITPVPGGVGPMTITMLLENTVLAAQRLGGEQDE